MDSFIESLLLTVSLECPGPVSILAPPGVQAAGERMDFRAGRALCVVHPTPGPWKLRLTGRGVFFVTAEAVSELSLDEARFVQPGGRPGHKGLFPVKRPPMLGSPGLLELDLAKGPAARNVRVQFVASDGGTLERLEVEPQSE